MLRRAFNSFTPNAKFPKQYHITQYEELSFPQLSQMRDYFIITNSHHLTYSAFFNLGVKGLRCGSTEPREWFRFRMKPRECITWAKTRAWCTRTEVMSGQLNRASGLRERVCLRCAPPNYVGGTRVAVWAREYAAFSVGSWSEAALLTVSWGACTPCTTSLSSSRINAACKKRAAPTVLTKCVNSGNWRCSGMCGDASTNTLITMATTLSSLMAGALPLDCVGSCFSPACGDRSDQVRSTSIHFREEDAGQGWREYQQTAQRQLRVCFGHRTMTKAGRREWL